MKKKSKYEQEELAANVYDLIAEQYAVDSNLSPFNRFYERPAMFDLIGCVEGKDILDIGCGHGYYAQAFLDGGARRVVGLDASGEMIRIARERLGRRVELYTGTASSVASIVHPSSFDLIVCPLVLHYIDDWTEVLRAFAVALRGSGALILSVGHPMEDSSSAHNYFDVELMREHWPSYDVVMPTYRRSLGAICSAIFSAGFVIDSLTEPLPSCELKAIDPVLYSELVASPKFLCIRASFCSRRTSSV